MVWNHVVELTHGLKDICCPLCDVVGFFRSFEVYLNVLQAIVAKSAEPNGPDIHRICVRAQ